ACAAVGLLVLAVGWSRPPGSFDAVAGWAVACAALALALALRGAGADPLRPWWPAGAALAAGATAAALALRQRRDEPAIAAGLALGLATSLVVAHFHEGEALVGWWVRLVQANVLAAAA